MTSACPTCLSPNYRGSRLRWYDFAMLLLLLQPQRCHTCFHRFYRSIWNAHSSVPQNGISANK
jgi:hypothetical protein